MSHAEINTLKKSFVAGIFDAGMSLLLAGDGDLFLAERKGKIYT